MVVPLTLSFLQSDERVVDSSPGFGLVSRLKVGLLRLMNNDTKELTTTTYRFFQSTRVKKKLFYPQLTSQHSRPAKGKLRSSLRLAACHPKEATIKLSDRTPNLSIRCLTYDVNVEGGGEGGRKTSKRHLVELIKTPQRVSQWVR